MPEPLDTDLNWPRPMSREDAAAHLAAIAPAGLATQVWDDLLAPLYDARQLTVHWSRGFCRYCNTPHPERWATSPGGRRGDPCPGHRMVCPRYVGPLEHRPNGGHQGPCGWRIECSCGRKYPERDAFAPDRCPDADVDWRGPRPDEATNA